MSKQQKLSSSFFEPKSAPKRKVHARAPTSVIAILPSLYVHHISSPTGALADGFVLFVLVVEQQTRTRNKLRDAEAVQAAQFVAQ